MDEAEYFENFMQDIYAAACAKENYYQTVFTERMCSFLEENAVVENFALAAFKKEAQGLRVDAWHLNKDTEVLSLFVTDFRAHNKIETLAQGEVDKWFKRVEKFFAKCKEKSFYETMEESIEGFEVAREVHQNLNSISRVRYILLSNATISNRVQVPLDKDDDGRVFSYDIWDIGRIARIELSGRAVEDLVIEFGKFMDRGVLCLPAFTGSASFQSYLLVMPGSVIAALYDQYGERLLEQNVRTFLQFRGDVNKGIRNTIKNQPDMFFAYNNGLSATAESVTVTSENVMTSVKNLQIVNGGQTTASLFTTMRKEKADLSKVYVQVKLSVIPPESVEDVVPRISEYANTQNKVNAADFFSNHPFHRRIESFSRQIWAPSAKGSITETHWFYERARGQYANVQSKMSDSQKRQFLVQNPKSQMFTKTDLAKFDNTLEMKPNVVSKGAQYNFSQFASEIGLAWEKHESSYNEVYFKRIVAKAIMFRSLDQLVMQQSWYGGYKANIVTYTLAKLSHMAVCARKHIDFMGVWKKQGISKAMETQLKVLAKLVNESITATDLNVTQYCKQEICWQRVRDDIRIKINADLLTELLDSELVAEEDKEAIRGQKALKGIEAQTSVLEKGSKYWKAMMAWGEENKVLSQNELSFLSSASKMPAKLPVEKQCERILEIESRAKKEGFVADG
jgi:hypothetical protein